MEVMLRLYPSKVNRVEHLRRQVALLPHESAGPADGMPRASGVSNPTLAKIERLETLEEEIADIEAWLKTVHAVLETLDERQGDIIKHLYLLPRSQQEYTLVGLAIRLSMGQSEAYRIKDEALLEFALVLIGHEIVTCWEESGKNQGRIGEADHHKAG
jgi:DNA-directed RNA polymerase sigma subunit (sigma70/sigma32)